jgi:hypothetical protein
LVARIGLRLNGELRIGGRKGAERRLEVHEVDRGAGDAGACNCNCKRQHHGYKDSLHSSLPE